MKKIFNWNSKTVSFKKAKKIKQDELFFSLDTFIEYLEEFLKQSDVQDISKKTYFKGLKKFLLWYQQESIECEKNIEEKNIRVSKQTIIDYKNYLIKSSLKPHTQAIYLTSLKQFFSWAEASLIMPNISKSIKGIRKITKQHHKDPLKKEEIKKLIKKKINHNSLIDVRNQLLITMLIFTGMRIGETTNILIEDIEKIQNNKYIIWIKGKGRIGKDTFISLVKVVVENLNKYIELRKKNGEKITDKTYLFISHSNNKELSKKMNTDSISRIVTSELKKQNIKTKRISAHSLRHSFGVHAISAGVSLYDLQISMRHSTQTTTQVYLGDIEKIKKKEGSTEQAIFSHIINKKK